jgi:nickel-dependent lactate racemase
MTTYYETGSPTTVLQEADLREALQQVAAQLGHREKVMLLPPDFTRFESRAGLISCLAHDIWQERITDVMPALGTHFAMPDAQLDKMFSSIPKHLFRVHDWRNDLKDVGVVPEAFVTEVTEGAYKRPWTAQMNRLVFEGGHDLILSIGQVVPHEVIGMANYNKNVFIGTGGARAINDSHFIGAAYGMERMMGRADTPLRKILNYAQDHFCAHMPLVFVLTVVGLEPSGESVLRGLFIGDDHECFWKASELAVDVNINLLDEAPQKVVAWLDDEEFHSTWLGNKAVYRSRMAIADGGELVVLAPGVKTFGEDPAIDKLIRKYGYRTTPEVMRFVEENEDLRENLSAAAHLIHGSSENRFTITYCPRELTRKQVEDVGYSYGDLDQMLARYHPEKMRDGWNEMPDGERVYFIRKPALGLWAQRAKFAVPVNS